MGLFSWRKKELPPRSLAEMKNLGQVSARQLRAVGITTPAQLRAAGAIKAYRAVKRAFPRETTLVMLWALQGALVNMHWNELPQDIRDALLAKVQRRPAATRAVKPKRRAAAKRRKG